MARRNQNRRRRRGSLTFLYKILCVLAICGVVVVALTLFFKVDTIQVSGERRYTEAEILEASGVTAGDNLFLLNKYSVANSLLEKLPYIEEVRINRKLPDTLSIQVTESSAVLAVEQEGVDWVISYGGKIVDSCKPEEAANIPKITGCELLAPSVGSQIALSTQQQGQQASLLALLAAVRSAAMNTQVNGIHMDSATELTMDYADRFAVKMLYSADFDYKLRNLQAVLDQLESNETGTIDLTKDGEAHVLPGSPPATAGVGADLAPAEPVEPEKPAADPAASSAAEPSVQPTQPSVQPAQPTVEDPGAAEKQAAGE